jgi:hypothetical protein
MKTCAEHLPIELWISIFYYLEIHDLFQAFNNLNTYFNTLLTSNYLSFYVQLEKCQNFYKQFPMHSPWSTQVLNRIICLKSSTHGQGKYISQFFYWHGKELLRLKSLTIEVKERELWPYCTEFFKTHRIEYLSLACMPNQTLLEGILSSPVLRKCRLYLWRSITSIDHTLNIHSNIEILYLKIKDNSNHEFVHLLLSHMPKLKRLEIIGDHVHCYFNPFRTQSSFIFSKLEQLKLIWLRPGMNADYFQRLLSLTPMIQHIYLGIYCQRLNELLFENLIHHWWPCLVKIPSIKIIIQCHRLADTMDNNEQILSDYYRKILSTINIQNDVCLKVKWIEENFETHTIKITIQKSF